jgi:hypothetical protein
MLLEISRKDSKKVVTRFLSFIIFGNKFIKLVDFCLLNP